MKIVQNDLKEAFRQAQDIITQDMESKEWEPDEIEPDLDWEVLYEAGLKKKKKIHAKYGRGAKIAIAIMLVLAVGIMSAFSVEACRVAITREVLRVGEIMGKYYDSFYIEQKYKNGYVIRPRHNLKTIYEPTYIPNGFEPEEEPINSPSFYSRDYWKGSFKNYLRFEQKDMGLLTTIDSENMKREKVTVQGYEGQLNYKKGETNLIWITDEYVFTIKSSLGKKEVLKVAESVAEKK